jgi:small subunit ribosomal protein S8
MMTDPIADFLTQIRNAIMRNKSKVILPSSKMKVCLAKILSEEGFIRNFKVVENETQGVLKLYLKYKDGEPAIRGLKRVSRPGRRAYVKNDSLPKVLNGLGIAIVSTSAGVMTDQLCREKGIGGEVLGYVW